MRKKKLLEKIKKGLKRIVLRFDKMETEYVEYKKPLAQLKKAIISIVAILNKLLKGKIILGMKEKGGLAALMLERIP